MVFTMGLKQDTNKKDRPQLESNFTNFFSGFFVFYTQNVQSLGSMVRVAAS